MFPINTDLKFYESAIPDTNFNDRVGTITNSNWAPLENKKYEKSAFGVGLHGLNYQNLVTNFKDFNGTKIYTGYKFLSWQPNPGYVAKAWNGTSYQPVAPRIPMTQISGYRCGDFRILKVPVFTGERAGDSLEKDKLLNVAWKDYACVSGNYNMLHGMELGKHSWVCSFGVGRTFKIRLKGTNSNGGTRKIYFEYVPYGIFSGTYNMQDLTYDSNTVDFQNASSLLTNQCPTSAAYVATILDVSSTGQKVLIAITAQDNDVEIDKFDNDGINYINSYPFAIVEIVFIQSGELLKLSANVIGNYRTTASYTGGSIMCAPNYTSLGKEETSIGYLFWGSPQSPSSYSNIPYTQLNLEFEADATGYTTYPPAGVSHNVRIGVSQRIAKNQTPNYESSATGYLGQDQVSGSFAVGFWCEPGSWYFTSYPTVQYNAELFHACYDKDDKIVRWWFGIRKMTGGTRVKNDVTFSGGMSHQVMTPNTNKTGNVANAHGSCNITIKETRLQGGVELDYFLMCDNKIINSTNFFDYTGATETIITRKYDYNYGYTPGTQTYNIQQIVSSDPTVTNPGSGKKFTPEIPGTNVVSFWGLSSLLPVKSGPIMDGYYVTDVPITGCTQIVPFANIESNKLISFNIGLKDYSMQRVKTYSGKYGLFLNRVVQGIHAYRAIYNMMDGSLIEANVEGFEKENPRFFASIYDRYSAYNYETGEVVIDMPDPVSWI